jgi:hypothetical protein
VSGPGRRALSRIVLVLLGLAGLGVAAIALWPLVTGGAPLPLATIVADGVAASGLLPTAAAWIVAAVLTLVVVIALVWALWPGRGRQALAIEADGVAVDTGVVQDLARSALAVTPEVLAVHAVTFRRRGVRWVRLTVQLRPRVDAAEVVSRVRVAIAGIDDALGERLPVVVHLTTGLRTAWATDRRVD